ALNWLVDNGIAIERHARQAYELKVDPFLRQVASSVGDHEATFKVGFHRVGENGRSLDPKDNRLRICIT
ncbi:hypothetical protein R0K18_25665, partial [Pantoea sp. SIMBA_133]